MSSGLKSVYRVVCIAGLLSLLHCAYSAAQHRFYLRLTEQPFTQLPVDLILQTLISLVAVVHGASYVAGDFIPVRSDLQNRSKSWDTVGNCPSFYIFDHRAKALSPAYSAFSRGFTQESVQVYNYALYTWVFYEQRTARGTQFLGGLIQNFFVFKLDSRQFYSFSNVVSSFPSILKSLVSAGLLGADKDTLCFATSYNHRKILYSIPYLHLSTALSSKSVSPFINSLKSEEVRTTNFPRAASQRLQFSDKAVHDALDHCIKLVRDRDFSNYVGALLMPVSAQPAVFSLLAFNVELAVVRDQIKRNSGTAGIYRLQFWKDTVETIYGGGKGVIPRQPVATALASFVRDPDVLLLNELVSSRQSTLGDRAFTSLENVVQYSCCTNGAIMKLVMKELASNNFSTEVEGSKGLQKGYEAADQMGAAIGILTLLRSAVPLLARGIVLLPVDLMSLHGLTADHFYNNKNSDALRRVTKDMSQAAKSHLSLSRQLKMDIPKCLRSALMANGATVDFLLGLLEKGGYNLFDARLQRCYDMLAWRLWWRKSLGRY